MSVREAVAKPTQLYKQALGMFLVTTVGVLGGMY